MIFLEVPALVEKSGLDDTAGRAGVNGDIDIDDGVIGQLGDLAGVIEVVVFAECETAVEDDVVVRV